MGASKRVRWECPNKAETDHPGVLGSTRPRLNSMVRFCVPCSVASGYLVERRAPALERKRAPRTAQATRPRPSARKRQAAAAGSTFETAQGPVDVDSLIREMCRLPTLESAWRASRHGYGAVRMPPRKLRRRTTGSYSGQAIAGGRIVLSFREGQDREVLEMIALHELTHYVLPHSEHHGDLFKRTYRKAAREFWPGIRLDETPSRVYSMEGAEDGLDGLIVRRAREVRKAAE